MITTCIPQVKTSVNPSWISITSVVQEKPENSGNSPVFSKEMNRLLAAAVVNKHFQKILLNNPHRALREGYYGDRFNLSLEETKLVSSIKSSNLADFAKQLIENVPSLDAFPEKRLSLERANGSVPSFSNRFNRSFKHLRVRQILTPC